MNPLHYYVDMTTFVFPSHKNALRLNSGNLAANRNVLRLARLGEAANLDTIAEQQAVRRTAKVEHTGLLTLLDVLALLDGDLTSRNLIHTDTDEGHESNGRVVSLDEDDGSCGEGSQITLTGRDAVCVDLLCVRVTETLEQRLAKVGTVLNVGFLDGAADGCVPTVVRQSRQEGLVNSAVGKLLCQAVVGQHISDTVGLSLDPESVSELCVLLDLEGLALAGVVNDAVVIRAVDGANFISEVSGEEVVPRSVTKVLLAGVTDEKVLKLVAGLVRAVGNGHHVRDTSLTEPTSFAIVKDTSRLWGQKELAPLVEDLLQHLVDLGIEEGGVTGRSGHGVVEDGAHGDTDHTDSLCRVSPDWSRTKDVVQDLEHVLVVTNLLAAGRVFGVVVLVRDLLEHGCKVHVDSRGALNEVLELLEDWIQRLLGVVSFLYLLAQPLCVCTTISWQPCSRSRYSLASCYEVGD
jgi:hypothetical protein